MINYIYKLKKKEGDKRDTYKEQNLRREKWLKTQDYTDLLQSILIFIRKHIMHIHKNSSTMSVSVQSQKLVTIGK